MKMYTARLGVLLFLFVWAVSPCWALLTGWNADVHMDIDPTGRTIANDFHVEGIIKSGEPGGAWSKPPLLITHVDDRFGIFTYSISPDPADPDQNTFFFKADWSGADYKFCEVLHLGLLFDVECHNMVIELVGWWTFNGQPLGGQNGGRVLIPGFDVQDEVKPQRLQVRNDSGGGGGLTDGINGYLRQLDVVAMTREELQQWGSPEILFEMLRLGGGQEMLPWMPVVVGEEAKPLQGPFMVDSFFDVFFDIDLPDPSVPHPIEPITIAPGGFLLVREAVEFPNNSGEPDVRWTWHFHEAHETQMHDLGDAPDSSNSWGVAMTAYPPGGPMQVQANFPTVYMVGSPPYGPIHWQPGAIHLGPMVTAPGETEADTGPDADGPNNIIPPQDMPDLDLADDGLIMPLNLQWCQPNNSFQYVVTVNNPVVPQMYVNVWFDWNIDGDWDDTLQCPQGLPVPEWAVQNQVVPIPGPGVYTMMTPAFAASWPLGPIDLPIDNIWMRITISEQPWQPTPGMTGDGGSGPQRGYNWGETEDYIIPRPSQEPRLDFGDAPDGAAALGYPTLAAHNGACHMIQGPWLGGANDAPDPENDGQPTPGADGDNLSGSNDENGVTFPILLRGQNANLTITVSGGGGGVDGWIDFNANNVWEPGERVVGAFFPDGTQTVTIGVPAAAVLGPTYARFRISKQGGLPPDGFASDGEVEDYLVNIEEEPQPELDFGDAPDRPYPTLAANNGARHLIGGPWLGDASDKPDPEFDGQPDPQALGDDNFDGNDDEDGVHIPRLIRGRPARIRFEVTGGGGGPIAGGHVDGWIDFNINGVWEPGEQVVNGFYPPGVHVVVVKVPADAIAGQTYARFRINSKNPLGPDGPAQDGEVEDHRVEIWVLTREVDVFEKAIGDMEIVLADGSTERIAVSGPATAHVYFEGTSEGDAGDDDGDGLDEVETEIVAMDLMGMSPALGPVTVRLNANVPSAGILEERVNNNPGLLDLDPFAPGDADSFFDVYVEIDVPGMGTLYNASAERIASVIRHKPPAPGDTYVGMQPVPLYYLANGGSTGLSLGKLRLIPNPLTEVDHFPDSAATLDLQWPDGTIEQVPLAGPMTQHVYFDGSVEGSANDGDGDGLDDVATEMIQLDLSGTSPAGPVVVRLHPAAPSPGVMEDQANNTPGTLDVPPFTPTGTVDSFFDIWTEISLDGGSTWMTPAQPLRVGGTITHKPQGPCEPLKTVLLEPLELFDASGQPTGILIVDWKLDPLPCDTDWGDAPDDGKAFNYPTLDANNGARHKIDPDVFLGDTIDPEGNGQPSVAADGDDTDADGDDEDGVKFVTWPLRPGLPATIEVTASIDGFLSVWIDFAADGDWTDPADAVFIGEPVAAGSNTLVFSVPAMAKPNTQTYGRFRFATHVVTSFEGVAEDGEVEDELVKVRSNPGVKWIQRPDVTPRGIDIRVDASDDVRRVLADDFECTDYGRITDVHLWGSWKDDVKGKITNIHLSIHSDDPVGPGGIDPENEYSKPNKLLWERDFGPEMFIESKYAVVEGGESWWDPYTGEFMMPGDKTIWKIDVRIPKREAFLQEGSPDKPVIYWLDVAVKTEGGEFGWKTRRWPAHFNDDAVMGVIDPRGGGSVLWHELRYPPNHPLYPASLDMAFVLTGDDLCTGCADLNCDGIVDLGDLAVMAEQYLTVWPFN